jgi:hypothetical protein
VEAILKRLRIWVRVLALQKPFLLRVYYGLDASKQDYDKYNYFHDNFISFAVAWTQSVRPRVQVSDRL